MMSLLISCVVGCSQSVKLAKPPMGEPIILDSIVSDKNDITGEKGFWINRTDTEKIYILKQRLESIDKNWK